MTKNGWLTILWLLCLTLAAGCGGDDDDDSAGDDSVDDDATPGDDDSSGDDEADAVSSASPENDSQVLTPAHDGWGSAACLTCHADPHRGGFIEGECVTCHGRNGAPDRPTGHAIADCASCHADSHQEMNFAERHCTACHKFAAGDACPATADYDVVVIGAGGGGLAAANMLAQAGLKTALVEKQYKVGGYMANFRRGDYRFEASLHAIGGLSGGESKDAFEDFHQLGIFDRLELHRSDPMYRSVFPGLTVDVPADLAAYQARLTELFPAEAAGIAALFAELQAIDLVLNAVTRLEENFNLDDLQILLANPGPTLRLLLYMKLSLKEMAARYISDPQLTGLWEQLVTFLGGGPADLQALYFLTMWFSYHGGGYYYPLGGSEAIAEAMADVFLESGGTLLLNTRATKIVIADGRATQVRTENDVCLNARYVVSNANAPDTLLNLVGEQYLPADYTAKLKQMTIGAATLQIFLGVDRDYAEYFPGTHEIMINETFDQDESYRFVADGDPEKVPIIIADYSVVDPTAAPAGKNVIAMATYLPYDWQETWQYAKGYERYDEFKEETAAIFIDRAEKFLPDLSQHVEVLEVGTPVTNSLFSLNPLGTIYGWANTPEQGTLRRLSQQTPIDNLLLAGAWTFPGGGQAAVISSGMSAAGMVLDKEAAGGSR
ncbi:MAG: FAD-dependent oxidoreductase [Myxococcales bacterium]|nr:FAD-dependent oxidoreductase [Myxococcales bacterium]